MQNTSVNNKKVAADKSELTEHQKAKLEYIFMEEESKISALKKNLDTSQKLLNSELEKESHNLIAIKNLEEEIARISSDIEMVKFETEYKIRGVLNPEQYGKFEKKIKKRREQKN